MPSELQSHSSKEPNAQDGHARSGRGRRPVHRPHSCGQCSRTYARKDHLVRHLQSHTAQRPFTCSHCGKGFGRTDLLIRHLSIHETTRSSFTIGLQSFSRRVTKACAPCATGKAKCDDEKPCRRCKRRGILCPPSLETETETESSGMALHLDSAPLAEPNENTSAISEVNDAENVVAFTTPTCLTDEEVQSIIIQHEPNTNLGATAMGCQYTGDLCVANGGLVTEALLDSCHGWDRIFATGSIQQASRSFHKLPWHANPTHASLHPSIDSYESNFDDLALEEDQYIPPLFDLEARKALLAALVSVALRWGWNSLSQCLSDRFPSPCLLDVLVYRFFKWHNKKIDPWIHSPTFRPVSHNIELTATIVAVSAINTPFSSLRRVGFIILKLLRSKIMDKIDDDFDSQLELQLIQAWMIQLETKLWHGTSFCSLGSNIIAEMIRFCMQREPHDRLPENYANPPVDTSKEELHRQWSLWVTSESYNRLMTRFCIYDNQSSMTLGTRTSTAISEYDLPLPQPRALWLAESPWEWRQIYLSSSLGYAPQIRNILPSISVTLQPESWLDKDLALKLVFHILGGQIIEFRESLHPFSVMIPSARENNELTSIQVRQLELKSAINNFQNVFSKRFYPSNIGSFIMSYLLMTLHASIKNIEILAGRKGEQESRQMYQAMKDWPNTSQAREAVWHAGQILRLFKALDKITSFQVVIVYHAGLVLFAYSTLFCTQPPQILHTGVDLPGLLVNGDSPEEREVFIHEGFAVPMLLGDSLGDYHDLTSLSNTQAVVKIVSEVILSRTSTCEWLSPHVVDGLVKLLAALGSAVHSSGNLQSAQGLETGFNLCPDLNFNFLGEWSADTVCA